MHAFSILAPAIAPLAVKLIDKYIFDENGPRRVPKIIEIPAPPQFVCCCGRTTHVSGTETAICSTCGPTTSSNQRPSRLRVPTTKSTARSSSTGDAYGSEKPRTSNSRIRTLSDSDIGSLKKANSRKSPDDTLEILACRLKQQISQRHSEEKMSAPCCSKSSTTERTGSKTKIHSASSSPCGSRKSCSKSCVSDSHRESSQNYDARCSEGCKSLKKY